MYACRYATPGGFRESALAAGLRGDDLLNADKQKQARHRMYTPGGPMARELAKNPTVLIVNDTLFAHGGVLKRHGNTPHSSPCVASTCSIQKACLCRYSPSFLHAAVSLSAYVIALQFSMGLRE